jgi:hypothetical protein
MNPKLKIPLRFELMTGFWGFVRHYLMRRKNIGPRGAEGEMHG